MVPGYHDTMVPWYHCYHGSIVHGTVVPRFHGTMVTWYHGTMIPWNHGTMITWKIRELEGRNPSTVVREVWGAQPPISARQQDMCQGMRLCFSTVRSMVIFLGYAPHLCAIVLLLFLVSPALTGGCASQIPCTSFEKLRPSSSPTFQIATMVPWYPGTMAIW